jgi:hypothetical protein
MHRCESCGFTYDLDLAEDAGERLLAGVLELNDVIRSLDEPGVRPAPATWSPLEYLCDVLLVQRERVLQARREDTPSFPPMGRDERVEHDGYAEQDPDDVIRQAADAASMFTNVLARLGPEDWERRVTYNFPTPMERSLRWVAVHTVHEVEHHLGDARQSDARQSDAGRSGAHVDRAGQTPSP